MSLIQVSDLTFAYEGSYDNIFDHASFQLDTNWRLGFTGRNGRGKTTFLNLLLGKFPYQGSISASVDFSYFPYAVPDESQLAMAVVEEICPECQYWQLNREMNLLELSEEVLWRPYSTLSNGERTKLQLAVLFLKENNFLLIDEPTNHLDIRGRELVSRYLNSKKGFILVSHDRSFLDGCVDHILSINKANIEVCRGNFSTWWENKSRQDAFEQAENEKLKKNIEVSKALADIGLLSAVPVPAADGAEYVQDGDVYFYLTRRLPGKQMESRRFANGDGRFVGEILGQLHLALEKIEDCVSEADLLATVKDWALPKSQAALNLTDSFCKEYLNTFKELYPKLPRQIIHRDPNPGNIICAEDQWGFIDFELAERNVRIYDVCYAATAVLSETFGQNNDKWLDIYRDVVCGYDSVAHLTAEERSAIPYVILANQFVCVAWFAEQDKYAEIFEINKQMTKWLIGQFEQLCQL